MRQCTIIYHLHIHLPCITTSLKPALFDHANYKILLDTHTQTYFATLEYEIEWRRLEECENDFSIIALYLIPDLATSSRW